MVEGVIRYLKASINKVLSEKPILTANADSDWTGSETDRKLMSSKFFKLRKIAYSVVHKKANLRNATFSRSRICFGCEHGTKNNVVDKITKRS